MGYHQHVALQFAPIPRNEMGLCSAFDVPREQDALARARVARFLLSVIIALAVVCTIILFVEFWQWIIIGGLIVIVLYMIRDNLRELRA